MHLKLFMYKQKNNMENLNNRQVYTSAHDAPLFNTFCPNSEKFKINVYYKGALILIAMTVQERSMDTYTELEVYLKKF